MAIGRLKAGPEAALIADYLDRFEKTGRSLGLGPARVQELDARGGGAAAEAALILKAIDGAGHVGALDERGKTMKSEAFGALMGRVRDDGIKDMVFVIGGADGLTDEIRQRAGTLLSFGAMVWPHMLARVMLSEQLYRGASVLAGLPYHRA